MKFEQNPKRCYMCSKAFSQAVKPIPVIGGKCAPGYVCPTCYNKLFRRDNKNDQKDLGNAARQLLQLVC